MRLSELGELVDQQKSAVTRAICVRLYKTGVFTVPLSISSANISSSIFELLCKSGLSNSRSEVEKHLFYGTYNNGRFHPFISSNHWI